MSSSHNWCHYLVCCLLLCALCWPLISSFYTATATTQIYTLSLHDALPIFPDALGPLPDFVHLHRWMRGEHLRSEEHTSELQSRFDLVCRLLLEKKNDVAMWSVPSSASR